MHDWWVFNKIVDDLFCYTRSCAAPPCLALSGLNSTTVRLLELIVNSGTCLLVVVAHGPISQQVFLHNMGISYRLKSLLSQTRDKQHRTDLLTSYKMLCSPDEMGDRFKFFAIHTKDKKHLPAGFSQLTWRWLLCFFYNIKNLLFIYFYIIKMKTPIIYIAIAKMLKWS